MANAIYYRLTADERACARVVAQIRNTLNGGQSNLLTDPLPVAERLEQHYRACVSEIVVSRLTNFCWTGCGKGADGLKDVGDLLEVRSVTSRHKGLLVRPKDRDDAPFVLVLVDEDSGGEILGWAMKADIVQFGIGRDLDSPFPYWTLKTDDPHMHKPTTLPLWRCLHDESA